MMTTIAIWATVVNKRESQKARNAAILKGSGTRLTSRALIGGSRGGNRLLSRPAAEVEPLDQPGHGQPLNQDRESDDDEGRDDDRATLWHGRRNGQRQSERERAT